MKARYFFLLSSFFLLSACGGEENANCSAYIGTNLPNDYVTGTCTDGRFTGYQPSTQQRASGVCESDGGGSSYVSGRLDNGTPFTGTCTES
jgi:hypothetical protein